MKRANNEQRKIVTFGKYMGKDIEWLVLSEESGRKLLICKEAVDTKPYHNRQEPATWENCSLRKWLNGDFYEKAFRQEEREKICFSNVPADGNPQWNVPSGNDTEDYVFLLSVKEVEKYFYSNSDRICVPSRYALDRGAWYCSDVKEYYGTCNWWLRTPGYAPNSDGYLTARVHFTGDVRPCGMGNYHNDHCVRPALWMKSE